MTELSCIMVKDGEYTYLIRFGMVTLTVNKWSPRIEGLFSFGAPFFARTSTSPGWVPGGTCSSEIPSTVFTYWNSKGISEVVMCPIENATKRRSKYNKKISSYK